MALLILAIAMLLSGAWVFDDVVGPTKIRRGTQVAGTNIDRIAVTDLATALAPLEDEAAATEIALLFDDQTINATAEELGIAIDVDAIAEKAAADSTSWLLRPVIWLSDFFTSREVDLVLTYDIVQVDAALRAVQRSPETPHVTLTDGEFEAALAPEVPIPDIARLTSLLDTADHDVVGDNHDEDNDSTEVEKVTVTVPTMGSEPPDMNALLLAIDLAQQANRISADGARLQLEGTSEIIEISEESLRSFMTMEGEGFQTRVGVDNQILNVLTDLFVGIGTEGSAAQIDVDFEENEDGVVKIIGGEPGFKCCHPDAADAILTGLLENHPVITLPPEMINHPQGQQWAESLELTALVGEFTTRFKSGESRVLNIARIAELTQGALIAPGEPFSVNDYVGPRTRAKGFVSAGVIYNGVFTESVGGGISQYATTLFNAAFFAGLDFDTYQSHSIYINRYPYGREATVSHPNPDLVIRNNTPYWVMIWPTTTASSITVRLYSTPWVVGEQTGQSTRRVGTSCTHVTTTRTRTWLNDGTTETDTVSARYRPEGIRCDGTPSVTTTTTTTTTTPPTTTTTTTTPPTTTTIPPDTTTTTPSDTTPPTTTTTPPDTTTTIPSEGDELTAATGIG